VNWLNYHTSDWIGWQWVWTSLCSNSARFWNIFFIADVLVDVCCSKLDAVFKIFFTFSSGIGCEACGLVIVLGKSPFGWASRAIFGPVKEFLLKSRIYVNFKRKLCKRWMIKLTLVVLICVFRVIQQLFKARSAEKGSALIYKNDHKCIPPALIVILR
jgi:hypothetical protein